MEVRTVTTDRQPKTRRSWRARAGTREEDRAAILQRRGLRLRAWSGATAMKRGQVLLGRRRLRESTVLRGSKPRHGQASLRSEFESRDAATCFEYYGGLATRSGDVHPSGRGAQLTLKNLASAAIILELPAMAAWSAPALCAVACGPQAAEATPAGPRAAAYGRIPICPGCRNIVTGTGHSGGDVAERSIARGFTARPVPAGHPARGAVSNLKPARWSWRQIAQHFLRRELGDGRGGGCFGVS